MTAPSRSFATGVFRFFLVSLLAIVLLMGSAFSIAFAVGWIQSADWTEPQYLIVGLVCGLVFWLFIAAFHLRRETQSMPFSQREQFVARAKSVLQEMGYALTGQHADSLSFRPRFHSYLFGGGIHVAVDQQEAKLTGPKVSLEIFRRCFRLVNHVQRVQAYLQEHRKFTDNVIKRAEIRMRLTPAQLDAVRKNVIELLAKESDVVTELNLLVQSDQGIRENTLEFQVREWLEQQGIECEIHKDLVQFVEVVQPDCEAVT